MNKQNAVYTLINECHDCYKCVRQCPVKAIKIENGHASVLPEKCIACGTCVKACPSNAKRVRSDLDRVKNLLLAQKQVYVSLAPSWVGVFDYSAKKMISVLKKLGFSQVSETALGAQEVSIKAAEILNNAENGLFISSACPVIVDYIRLYNPEYAKYITPIASPALTHAKILKEKYGENISVVFIGPCIGKKKESDKNRDLIDASLTFEELKYWINDEAIDVAEITVDDKASFVPDRAFEGAIYPLDGGMNETIKRVGIKKDVQLLNICSLHAFTKALNGLKPEEIKSTIFIEALACEGGCVAGPCISTQKPGVSRMTKVLNNTRYREDIPKTPSTVVELEYKPDAVPQFDYPIGEILKAMKKIGKHSEADELNCGGCGYSTCRELANALISGDAEPSMCVSYMRKIAMRKAAAMLRCMPSAAVMVDNKLRVVEANDSFMRMFCGDMYEVFAARQDGLVGAAIDRIIDFSDIFKQALKSGKDIHKERFQIKKRIYDIVAFTIEKDEIVGAIITDVTQSETNREKISQKAQEVISKNISIVQEIACLLGEHMVDTEMILSSIANDFDDDSSSNSGNNSNGNGV
jgi:iron only hydrogenase large subunit-like protein